MKRYTVFFHGSVVLLENDLQDGEKPDDIQTVQNLLGRAGVVVDEVEHLTEDEV